MKYEEMSTEQGTIILWERYTEQTERYSETFEQTDPAERREQPAVQALRGNHRSPWSQRAATAP